MKAYSSAKRSLPEACPGFIGFKDDGVEWWRAKDPPEQDDEVQLSPRKSPRGASTRRAAWRLSSKLTALHLT